jgi:hypothetical protein
MRLEYPDPLRFSALAGVSAQCPLPTCRRINLIWRNAAPTIKVIVVNADLFRPVRLEQEE